MRPSKDLRSRKSESVLTPYLETGKNWRVNPQVLRFSPKAFRDRYIPLLHQWILCLKAGSGKKWKLKSKYSNLHRNESLDSRDFLLHQTTKRNTRQQRDWPSLWRLL